MLGSLDDGVLNSLGLTAWGYPRQPPLHPNILLPFRGKLSKMPCLEEKAPLETQASLTQLCSPQSTGQGTVVLGITSSKTDQSKTSQPAIH